MKKILVFSAVLMMLASCKKLDGEVKMVVGEILSNNEVWLKFLDYEDTRCPEGATCITEGYVKVWMHLEEKSSSASVGFNIGNVNGPNENQFSAFGYNIRFIDLVPHPKQGVSQSKDNVKLHLLISKM